MFQNGKVRNKLPKLAQWTSMGKMRLNAVTGVAGQRDVGPKSLEVLTLKTSIVPYLIHPYLLKVHNLLFT